MEVDVTLEELAQILGEDLELPNIEPKGKDNIEDLKYKYTGIQQQGPESLKHFKRTYKQALKRTISVGKYDASNPVIIPIKEDKRYRAFNIDKKPVANAVIIYMMDVSGSMGDEQKEVVRLTSFWLDTWLSQQYNDSRKILIHDTEEKSTTILFLRRKNQVGHSLVQLIISSRTYNRKL